MSQGQLESDLTINPYCRTEIETSRVVMTPSGSVVDGFTEVQLSSQIIHGRAALEPYYHPRTHSIPAATIHLRSYEVPLLDLFSKFATHAASALAIPISKPTPLPTQRSLWTVPKGPFAHKKSQENFDRKTHKRIIKAWDTDPEVIERWIRYLESHALAGVGLRAIRWERAPVGIGKKILESVRGELRGTRKVEAPTTKDQVKKLAAKVVQQELSSVPQASSKSVQKLRK